MKNILLSIACVISFCNAELNYPNNDQHLTYRHILFEWDQEPDAISYNLQLSNQQSFNNMIVDVEEITAVYIDTQNIDWDNTYYWKVRPVYENGDYGFWINN